MTDSFVKGASYKDCIAMQPGTRMSKKLACLPTFFQASLGDKAFDAFFLVHHLQNECFQRDLSGTKTLQLIKR